MAEPTRDEHTNSSNGDTFQVSGMGFSALLKSKDVILPLFYALLSCVMFYAIYTQHIEQNNQFNLIIQQLAQANELQYLQTWQLSRPQEERLPVRPPPQLWKYLDEQAVTRPETVVVPKTALPGLKGPVRQTPNP